MPTLTDLSSSRSKLVYLYLREHGSATPAELRTALGLPLIALLPTLGYLEETALVRRRDGEYLVEE